MPMPATITADDLLRWQKSFKEWDPAADGLPAGIKAVIHPERHWYPGEWLGEELQKLGATDQQIKDICVANGQRSAAGADCWASAQMALLDFQKGSVNTNVPTLMIDKKAGTMQYIDDGVETQFKDEP